MQKAIITIVYYSHGGHTEQIAAILANNLRSKYSEVFLIQTEEAIEKIDILHASDAIIFGSPTYFGNVSSGFKQFMEDTGKFWFKQPWKDKLAAGFTVSSTTNGDKLNTLVSMALFAAQHGMIWVSQGVMPRFINDEQTDGQNRMASYMELMVQSDNGKKPNPPHPGDILTTELFAKRILEFTIQFKNIKIETFDLLSN